MLRHAFNNVFSKISLIQDANTSLKSYLYVRLSVGWLTAVNKKSNLIREKLVLGAQGLRCGCRPIVGGSAAYSRSSRRSVVPFTQLSLRNKRSESNRNAGESVGVTGFMVALLGFLNRKPQLSPEDELLLEIKRGVLAMQEGEFPKAERHFADSWKMSTELNLEEVKTQIMDFQANLAMAKGEIDKAIRLFQLVTQRLVFHQKFSTTDNTIIEISLKMAQMFAMKGQIDESVKGFEYCAETQKKKISEGADDEDTLMLAAWSLQSLAQSYMGSGNIDAKISKEHLTKASQYAKEAYNYVIQAVGPQSQQAIAIASDLASIIALEGDVESALKKLDDCDRVAAEKFKYLQAAIRINTGNLYLQKGEFSEAERICKEAKAIAGVFRDFESVMRAEKCIAQSREGKSKKPKEP